MKRNDKHSKLRINDPIRRMPLASVDIGPRGGGGARDGLNPERKTHYYMKLCAGMLDVYYKFKKDASLFTDRLIC